MMKNQLIIFGLILISTHFPALSSANTSAAAEPRKIKIAVKEFPPLVFKDKKGFCIDLAKTISGAHNLDPEFVMYSSVPELLDAVESQECNMGFAGITITPYAKLSIRDVMLSILLC